MLSDIIITILICFSYQVSHLGIEDEEASKLWQVMGSSSKVISQFELPDQCSRMYLTCYFYTPWKHQEVRFSEFQVL